MKRPSCNTVISATRLHFPAGTEKLPDATVQHLRNYAINTQALQLAGAIAVNCLQDEIQQVAKEAAPDLNLTVLHVPVWGAFVPALNTLLGEAQRREFQYILFQSLEVKCSKPVLRKMLDHHTRDTLVVGPVLDGHVFDEGMQALHGRSSPWNTLALWNMRKLALTGFLSIADGLPKTAKRMSRQITGEPDGPGSGLARQMSGDPERAVTPFDANGAMGGDGWWSGARQKSELAVEVPAGVEEVTAVALLQHLMGPERARAILIELPPELVEWKANWGGDERRRQWHEYKMASKVARPAAQIRQLFRSSPAWPSPRAMLRSIMPAKAEPLLGKAQPESQDEQAKLNFGEVMHFGQSIRPAWGTEMLCLSAFCLFSANFAVSFASAFRTLNKGEVTVPEVAWVGLLISAAYIPIPASLWLTRKIVSAFDHRAGLAMCVGFLVVSHACIVWNQIAWQDAGSDYDWFLLGARLLQGMGAGILFQARFVLASLSTHHHHVNLQARSFFATDLGLGIGALLPWMVCKAAGYEELPAASPELLPSFAMAVLSLLLLIGLITLFPKRLHRLPMRVRFPGEMLSKKGTMVISDEGEEGVSGTQGKAALLVSGTARIFVQSAAVMALALWMRDIGVSGHFMQTRGMAMLCLLPLPLQVIAAKDVMSQWSRVVSFAMLAIVVLLVCATNLATPQMAPQLGGIKEQFALPIFAMELLVLLLSLTMAAPVRVSTLYQLKDAERLLVTLEWLKAYIGRIIGPTFVIVVQIWFGYRPLMLALCAITTFVAVTA